jgi:hypothetical protein
VLLMVACGACFMCTRRDPAGLPDLALAEARDFNI